MRKLAKSDIDKITDLLNKKVRSIALEMHQSISPNNPKINILSRRLNADDYRLHALTFVEAMDSIRVVTSILIGKFGETDSDLFDSRWGVGAMFNKLLIARRPVSNLLLVARNDSKISSHLMQISNGLTELINALMNVIEEANKLSTYKQRIPKQVVAPVMPEVVNDVLVPRPGRAVRRSPMLKEQANYLAGELQEIVSELSTGSNVDPRVIEVFRSTETLLQDWSITKLIAFGSRVELLEDYAGTVKEQASDLYATRVSRFLQECRRFVHQFPEWAAYIDKSLEFKAKHDETVGVRIIEATKEAEQILIANPASVDSNIPAALNEMTTLASRPSEIPRYRLGVLSSARSLRNISIALVEYAQKAEKTGTATITDPRVWKMLKVVCNFLPLLVAVSPHVPGLGFIHDYQAGLRLLCDGIQKSVKS